MSNSERKLADELTRLHRRIDKLERGSRPTQLGHSSIEDSNVRSYDNSGNIRQVTGKQSDGRFATTYVNGPAPDTPTDPNLSARELGAVIGWDGQFQGGSVPSDLQRVDAHVSETQGFTPDGTTVVGSLTGRGALSIFADAQTHYVKLVAVTTSQVPSTPTNEVSFTPLPATNLSVTDDILIHPGGRIIAGDPDAERIQLGETGLRQFDEDGDATVIIGDNPSAGNTITIRGTSTETRRNLSPNPKLQNNADDWSGSNATLTREDGTNVGTDWCFRATGNGSNNPFISMVLDGLSGRTISFSFTVYSSIAQTLSLDYNGTDPQGGAISTVRLDSHDFSAGETHILSGVAEIPDNMVSTQPHVVSDQQPLNSPDFFDVSLMLVEESPAPRQYFDGDSTILWVQENAVPNPGFEEGDSGWVGTIVQSSDVANTGSFSGKIEPDGSSSTIDAATGHFPTHAGQSVDYEFSTYLNVAGIAATVSLTWYDVDHNFLSRDQLADLSGDSASGWITRSGTVIAPSSARFADYFVELTGTPATTDIVYVDDFSGVSSALDQTTTGEWSGDAGNSQSSIVGPPTRIRQNLIENPKLDNNDDGYGGIRVSSTTRVDSSTHLFTTTEWAEQVVLDSGQTNPAVTIGSPGRIRVDPLSTYVLSVELHTNVSGLGLRVYLDQYDAESGGNFIGSDYSDPASPDVDTPFRLTFQFNILASAQYVQPIVIVIVDSAPSGEFYVTRGVFEPTERFDGYFDGDSQNSEWTEIEGNSTSQLVEVEKFENKTLGSLSDSGDMTVQRVSTQELMLGGMTVTEMIEPRSNGTLARSGRVPGESPHTTSEIGWYEISFITPPVRRLYNIYLHAIYSQNATTYMVIRYTEDGSAPTVESNSAGGTIGNANSSTTISAFTQFSFPPNKRIRLLATILSPSGNEVWVSHDSWMFVTDAGLYREPSYVLNDGSGTGVPEPSTQQYNTHWRAVAGQTWNQHGFRENAIAYQGFYPDGWNGDNKSIFFFDWANIQATLAGSSIDYVDIFVYFDHWYYNSGGTAVFGHSNKSSPGGSYAISDWGIAEYHIGKGAGRWCRLPLWVGHGFRDDWIKTINLDSAFKGHDLVYYGHAAWDAVLSIGYTK